MTVTRRNAIALLAIKGAFGASLAFGFANVHIPAPATEYAPAIAMDAAGVDISGDTAPAPAVVDVCAVS